MRLGPPWLERKVWVLTCLHMLILLQYFLMLASPGPCLNQMLLMSYMHPLYMLFSLLLHLLRML